METVQGVASVLAWFVSVPLVILILLQSGSGDLSSNFGGGQLDSSLGVGASKKMAQVTGILALSFLVLVILLGIRVDSLESLAVPTDEVEASASVEGSTDTAESPAVELTPSIAETEDPAAFEAAADAAATEAEAAATETVEQVTQQAAAAVEAIEAAAPAVEAVPEEGSAPAIELED